MNCGWNLVVNLLFMLIYVYLWKALYTGKTAVEGYDLNAILTVHRYLAKFADLCVYTARRANY